jgi:hypothetical protein
MVTHGTARGAWLAVGLLLASTAAFAQTFMDAVAGGSAQQVLAARFAANPVVVTVLLDAGADRNAHSTGGLRAADFALANECLEGSAAAAALRRP